MSKDKSDPLQDPINAFYNEKFPQLKLPSNKIVLETAIEDNQLQKLFPQEGIMTTEWGTAYVTSKHPNSIIMVQSKYNQNPTIVFGSPNHQSDSHSMTYLLSGVILSHPISLEAEVTASRVVHRPRMLKDLDESPLHPSQTTPTVDYTGSRNDKYVFLGKDSSLRTKL